MTSLQKLSRRDDYCYLHKICIRSIQWFTNICRTKMVKIHNLGINHSKYNTLNTRQYAFNCSNHTVGKDYCKLSELESKECRLKTKD